ncbi:MAG TPA: lysine--tRNA ligase [Methyloprofundus sp.]|uniref:lysine--tRNA ligase n=1 Tax=Methyloprofundus sp. TaxID=2020875 RepID=UPI0017C66558|nr:lysine--tRNA ligase [Methyloprofundus sp.]HIG64723.1 lysine--tRNA ligase [Methyloprofundus sp.]HIL79596.1 lysine--tRNA ligase [Methylococcales bacterium]
MSELEHDEQEQIKQRRIKLNALRENGAIAFPTDFRRNVIAGELIAEYNAKTKEELDADPVRVKLAGRLMTRRIMGKASFAHIQDMSGKIQLYVTRDTLAEGFYNEQFKKWDIGDIIGAEGVLFRTKVGELSVKVDDIRLLTKSLRPLPEKFHGIADKEIKYRQRYLDLIMSDDSRNTFLMRSKIVAYIRQFLIERQFLEVETPMMQTIPGGATARPFETFHNALDLGMYLRIAPELYLKRLVVGGFERVFEINRNFRNEGLSTRHNPEFTMLEFYQAYTEYGELMDLTEAMLKGLAEDVVGQAEITYQGEVYDFGKPFQRMTVFDSILHFNPDLNPADIASREAAVSVAENLRIPVKESYGLGKVQIEIFEKTVESRLMNPTFITAYPVEVSPLARRNDDDPHVTDRFEFFVGGREIANGFTELNDSEDQAERFMQQVQEKEAGDDEAMHFDADYITALEHGMPPTAGEGIGIDRLVMLFTDAPSIRDVLLFPHMRPKA